MWRSEVLSEDGRLASDGRQISGPVLLCVMSGITHNTIGPAVTARSIPLVPLQLGLHSCPMLLRR